MKKKITQASQTPDAASKAASAASADQQGESVAMRAVDASSATPTVEQLAHLAAEAFRPGDDPAAAVTRARQLWAKAKRALRPAPAPGSEEEKDLLGLRDLFWLCPEVPRPKSWPVTFDEFLHLMMPNSNSSSRPRVFDEFCRSELERCAGAGIPKETPEQYSEREACTRFCRENTLEEFLKGKPDRAGALQQYQKMQEDHIQSHKAEVQRELTDSNAESVREEHRQGFRDDYSYVTAAVKFQRWFKSNQTILATNARRKGANTLWQLPNLEYPATPQKVIVELEVKKPFEVFKRYLDTPPGRRWQEACQRRSRMDTKRAVRNGSTSWPFSSESSPGTLLPSSPFPNPGSSQNHRPG